MARRARRTVLLVILLGGELPAEGPLSPEASLEALQLEPGLRVELAAAEPDVMDPVALAFDERGRLFVVEGRGYPTDEGRGVVALLEDPDGDGRFTRRSVFAEGLRFPNGVLPWKGGLFVTDSPELLYLEDRDGDGRADTRQVVLTGFATDRSSQLRVNDPTPGLDGWIYLAGGLSGGSVTSPRLPEHPAVDLKRADLRFHPDTGAFEAIDGKSQFGISFDDFGRRFICMNRIQAQHVVMESRHLRRNPHLAFSDTVQNLPEERVDDLLRGHNAAARIYPISDNLTTADSHAGTFSAACAVTVWRGGSLPERFDGQVFSCDPTGNLVHRDELVPRGATFVARRSREPREFLASPDNWFRPVFLGSGPDGALYVCDMYRKTIEHPKYLPEEVRKRTDFASGRDRGRIYRVIGRSAAQTRPPSDPALGDRAIERLVESLGSGDAWTRDTAFRLLLARLDRLDAAALRRLALAGQPAPAQAMALGLLDRLGALRSSDLEKALASPSPGVREVALRLAETRLEGSPALAPSVLARAGDPDARVRFQSALALGRIATPEAARALETIARRGGSDRWTRAAVISSAAGREVELLGRLLEKPPSSAERGLLDFLGELARTAARAAPGETGGLLRRAFDAQPADDAAWPFALLNGLARGGLLRGDKAPRPRRYLDELAARAARWATAPERPLELRLDAVEFLGHAGPGGHVDTLVSLIQPASPRALQIAAVRALRRAAPGSLAETFPPERWTSCAAPVREAILETFLPRREHALAFLGALESGDVPLSGVSPAARQRLVKHAEADIRKRAARHFSAAGGDRQKVFEELKAVLSLEGDPRKGRVVFRELCSTCHRLDREGVNVGPDLFANRRQTKETILLHVVVPNHEVTPGFEAHVVTMRTGEVLAGLLTSETPTSITLRGSGG
ncbi:MAG: HEAT repeat domain-containing protein, partial [Planctomycetota bacterium]|nr:HEAT repeat domain-containing protein [Planctomycetota bacterium]